MKILRQTAQTDRRNEENTLDFSPCADRKIMNETTPKKRILILGGGFAGLHAALELERRMPMNSDIEAMLVSRVNYSLFTPLLHEVATAELDARAVVNPFRKMLRRVRFVAGEIREIDLEMKKARVIPTALPEFEESAALEIHYDYLVLALGSTTNFYDLPGIEANALTMKSLPDAMLLRDVILGSCEAAENADESERVRRLTFVVVGGGFAGVETVGGINDFVRDLARRYPHLDETMPRIVLAHSENALLPEFKGELADYTLRQLRRRGIDVRLKTRVAAASETHVEFADGSRLPFGVLIWTAGVSPDPLIAELPLAKHRGRIATNEFLEVRDFPGVWATGDCAAVPVGSSADFYAPLAQFAERMGKVCARNVLAQINGERKKAFQYKMLGQLAAIGRRSGVARIAGFQFSGFPAWILWRAVYLMKLPRLEKKTQVMLNWLLNEVFDRDLVQLFSQDSLNYLSGRAEKFLAWKQEKELLTADSPVERKGIAAAKAD